MSNMPTPPSTLWKVTAACAVFTGISIWQQWDWRISTVGGVLTLLIGGVYIYTVYTEKKVERIKKEAEAAKK